MSRRKGVLVGWRDFLEQSHELCFHGNSILPPSSTATLFEQLLAT
jgi:hypothetical protein